MSRLKTNTLCKHGVNNTHIGLTIVVAVALPSYPFQQSKTGAVGIEQSWLIIWKREWFDLLSVLAIQ